MMGWKIPIKISPGRPYPNKDVDIILK